MAPTLFTVVQRHDEWHVLKAGAAEPVGRFKSKTDAIDLGRNLALREESAVLRVAAIGGAIQSEQAFGQDPMVLEGASPVSPG